MPAGDVWGNSWLSTWGNSWAAAQAPTPLSVATEVDVVLHSVDSIALEPDRAISIGPPDDVKIPRG